MSLSNRAMLVSVSTSVCEFRKNDRKASRSVESTHKTDAAVGGYRKQLFPGAKELEAVKQQRGAINTFFIKQTLPWLTDGTRILSSLNYIPFMKTFRDMRAEFNLRVTKFIDAYPDLRVEAQRALGDLFNVDEYPHQHTLHANLRAVCESHQSAT